jgi:formylglycine-generating enzyme required for sulfatase activity
MMPIRTHYDNLKVSRDAPEVVIKASFKALSLKHHPDRNSDKVSAEKTFKIILQSYEILIDPDLRRKHDKWIVKQEAASQDGSAEKRQKTRSKEEVETALNIPRYIKAVISLHTAILAFIRHIFDSIKVLFRLITYPATLFGIFAVVSTYQMWSWSQTGAINSFLDRFLDRKVELDPIAKLIDESDSFATFISSLLEDIELVAISGGTFLMGSNTGFEDEMPPHMVTVPPFEIGLHEVTFDTWEICVRAGGCLEMPDDRGWGRGTMPVINVSHDEISNQFLPWLNKVTASSYRLPTESEWEYAAKAGTNTEYSWGNDIGVGLANCSGECGDEFRYSSPVGSFEPNTYGLYDMHGNVWEWVEDCASPDYKNTPIDGSAYMVERCQRHTTRGGSWGADASNARSAARSRMNGREKFYSLGFRLARDVNLGKSDN